MKSRLVFMNVVGSTWTCNLLSIDVAYATCETYPGARICTRCRLLGQVRETPFYHRLQLTAVFKSRLLQHAQKRAAFRPPFCSGLRTRDAGQTK